MVQELRPRIDIDDRDGSMAANLSQDRLSYQLFENWGSPIEDIGWRNDPGSTLDTTSQRRLCG